MSAASPPGGIGVAFSGACRTAARDALTASGEAGSATPRGQSSTVADQQYCEVILPPDCRFPGQCCFRVIYFVRNIFSLWLRRTARAALAETRSLTRVVKNARANRRFAGFAWDLAFPERARKWRD
jgi:hypothetical protein